MHPAAADAFTVEPANGAVLWAVVLALCWTAGIVTALKGRWGWLLVGLLFGGLLWPLTATMLPAEPGSVWARRWRGWDATDTRGAWVGLVTFAGVAVIGCVTVGAELAMWLVAFIVAVMAMLATSFVLRRALRRDPSAN